VHRSVISVIRLGPPPHGSTAISTNLVFSTVNGRRLRELNIASTFTWLSFVMLLLELTLNSSCAATSASTASMMICTRRVRAGDNHGGTAARL